MNLEATKMELIEMLLSTKKATVLKKVKAILEEDQAQLTKEDYAIIDARRDSHLKGESKSFSWEQTKKQILKS
ncbi:hypothetical protein [Flavobacterium sp. ZB4R12]|uniref:hypothetical protein n=1 Tax=Flavobacterium sp. ZB4R12 TaxID=3398732 RepID=UPI003AAD47A0